MSKMKEYVKLLVPPVFLHLKRKLNSGNSFKALSLGERPDKQDIDLYWDESYANVLEEWGKDNVWIEIELIFSTLKGKVLDIACGTGPTIQILNRNPNLEVHGFDISDLLIKRAIQKGILESRLKVADATKISYAENEFDYSFSIGSIEHFTEEGIDLFIRNSAYYTREYSFHMLPANRDGKDKGWEKTEQSYFNNSVRWWMKKFEKHFSDIKVIDSTWAALDQQGKWFVCHK
ncbi:MAG: class I SAM-dependent methyltransferase [Chitinophagaceae bacterium]|nr:class I SAM-dependent methyltransferase [Chitinophagaceae bacterium]